MFRESRSSDPTGFKQQWSDLVARTQEADHRILSALRYTHALAKGLIDLDFSVRGAYLRLYTGKGDMSYAETLQTWKLHCTLIRSDSPDHTNNCPIFILTLPPVALDKRSYILQPLERPSNETVHELHMRPNEHCLSMLDSGEAARLSSAVNNDRTTLSSVVTDLRTGLLRAIQGRQYMSDLSLSEAILLSIEEGFGHTALGKHFDLIDVRARAVAAGGDLLNQQHIQWNYYERLRSRSIPFTKALGETAQYPGSRRRHAPSPETASLETHIGLVYKDIR